MTSKDETQKTSEFLHRRKLRLQQVREQSKDIAKKIRQRAKVEELRQVVELDQKKERDYIQSQERVVKKLEELYSRGLDNVGNSHQQARGLTQTVSDTLTDKNDLSHLRGREAAAELKKRKQQKFNEIKRALDRKVKAREAANVLSREKSVTAANKLPTKSSSTKLQVDEVVRSTSEDVNDGCDVNKDLPKGVSRSDMGTQWDVDILQAEWEPNIPTLNLPKDDSVKESVVNSEKNTDKQKRPDLFAVSDEMPSSLRGGTHKPCEAGPSRLSSTLVSEYIQNRALRLRESELGTSIKKHSEDLKNLRQTIIRSRPLQAEGSDFNSNICHVVEGQVLPMPKWRAETGCQRVTPRSLLISQPLEKKPLTDHLNITDNFEKFSSSVRLVKPNSVSCCVPKKSRPFTLPTYSGNSNESLLKGKGFENVLAKKKSITMYNHSTRDSRDVRRAGEQSAAARCERDAPPPPLQDAYSRALSETTSAADCAKHTHKRNHDMTNRVAVTRQNVEKEYKDTIAFLNSLPRSKNSRSINNAFKDDSRLQAQKDSRQRMMQQEFKNIEQESRRHGSQGSTTTSTFHERGHNKRSRLPSGLNEDYLRDRDFQYSWMPVPERDSHLAVHAIPSARAGVKFSDVASYHEYRSRHKHTPPTKDTHRPSRPTDTNRRPVHTLTLQNDDVSCSGSSVSETSVDSRRLAPESAQGANEIQPDTVLTDMERIIVNKFLNHKHRKNNNSVKNNKRTSNTEEEELPESSSKETANGEVTEIDDGSHAENKNDPLNCESLNEGLYKVRSNTELFYNILNPTNVDPWQTIADRKYWWENLESIYYANSDESQRKINYSKTSKSNKNRQDSICRNKAEGDAQQSRKKCTSSKCKSRNPVSHPAAESSIRPLEKPTTELTSREAGFVKLIDDGEKQEGNFYIGATGFLKDDAYEVIIQLRKKDTGKAEEVKEVEPDIKINDGNENTSNTKGLGSESLPPQDHVQEVINISEHSTVEAHPQVDTSAGNPSQEHKSTAQHCPSSTGNNEETMLKSTHDRRVSPITKDIYPFSEPATVSIPIARPATSTYTQTTLSSPNPRPAYIHMSSSTSTAYMSPPEVVLPHSLRRGHEQYSKDSPRNSERYERQKHKRQDRHCKKYCSCKISKKILPEPSTTDQLQSNGVLTTANVRHGTYKNVCKGKTETASSSPDLHRCLLSRLRADSKPCLCCKQHCHKSKQVNTANDSKSIWNVKKSIVRSKKNRTHTHSGQSYLNPRIKEYIHKLLSLNREGIKTIQIINQDCSSVNTPGSSIINVPTNRNIKTSHRRDFDFSLEQIKHVLKQRIFLTDNFSTCRPDEIIETETFVPKNIKLRKRNSKKKKLHKVKSLNISKKINKKSFEASSTTRASSGSKVQLSGNQRVRDAPASESSKSHAQSSSSSGNKIIKTDANKVLPKGKEQHVGDDSSSSQPKPAVPSDTTSSNSNETDTRRKCMAQPINTSTQTNRTVDEELNFIKLAEGKLQNMEKIADLTEKCSKRLSNLAKVLEEVRKNKSIAYSQISTPDSTSDSDQRPDKIVGPDGELILPPTVSSEQISENVDSTDYESLISGVPKSSKIESSDNKQSENISSDNTNTDFTSKPTTTTNEEIRLNNTKCRNKPPPALLRINLKRPQENIVPHELSTVIEVDSPSSVKFKSQSSSTNISHSTKIKSDPKKDERTTETRYLNPELIMSMVNKSSNDKMKMISADSSDDSKLQMMDLNQFNEIMLRPFISLQEYAQDFYEVNMDTKCESILKEVGFTDDISSLHSDGSLPDVVAELLKRKLITEPFRFDTASNVNSTTVSSESSVSALASSKTHKDKNKSKLSANKENVGEVSDSLSISSNPDLENAFKKLGMGWASSTLKKTKERLALSSSSNTSSSSLSLIKFKNSSKLVSDSISTVPNVSRKTVLRRQLDASRNAEQQTSFTNSMTVKEFLTKELAKKITFTEKSDRNDTNLEFVSLFETKLPEGLKNSSQTLLENDSGGSAPSCNNNRARTSTPVNVLKSPTYRSSSSSNMSNGLFSNADDLSSVKLTSTSVRHHSTSEKDELTIPNCSLKMRKALSDCSKTDSC